MDEIDLIIVVMFFVLVSLGLVIFLPVSDIQEQEKIENICSYIFNPATSLSNYTSYKHCILYPETYGVDK